MVPARFGLILALALTGAGPAAAADPEPAAVDRAVTDAMTAFDVPGAALVVVRDGRVVVLKGYGRKRFDRPEPVTPDTLFPLASCTKAFTSTLLAMLVDDGKVAWDDLVRKHLPGFHLADPEADAKVTLRDLLAHRTGVGGNDLLWYHAPWGVDEVLRRIPKLPMEYPFRGGFQYSSLMYMAAGRAAAQAGGKPWEVLVKERITDPLGMKGIAFTSKEIPATADRATGHRLANRERQRPEPRLEIMPAYEIREPNPAGSIFATPRDLAAWMQFHLSEGLADGKRLVSAKALAETHTAQNTIPLEGNARAMNPDTERLSYGMGWVVNDHRGKKVVAHGGMIDGFRVQITLLPEEKLGIALLNNLHETRMNQAVTNTLIDLYCGLSPRDWNEFFLKLVADAEAARRAALDARDRARNPDTKPSLPLEMYAGDYEDPAYGKARLSAKDGKLTLEWSSFTMPLEHYQDDVFRVTEGYFQDRLVELIPADGKATAIRFIGVMFRRK
jgi:CubicO group peptidase (beta-lactamase class C family)